MMNMFSFMNIKAVRYQIEHERMLLSDYYVSFYDKDVDCIAGLYYDVFVYFVDIASDCLIETRFVDCIDAYGLRDILTDGVFYVPGAVCLGYRINR